MGKRTKKTRIFSALEVANICGVVNQTAINWIKNNYLKAFTTPGGQYRIYSDDLLAFLDSRNMRIPDELKGWESEETEMSIIIIDDDTDLNNLIRRNLAREFPGIGIEQAFDGFEAGALIAKMKPQVVVLDIQLPGVNGHTICRNIKTDSSFGNPFVVAISGADEPDAREAILTEGADAFFSKPIDFTELVEVIGRSVSVRV